MTESSDETLICPQCSQASQASTVADPPLCPACGTALRPPDPASTRSNSGLSLGAPELDEEELTPDLARPDTPPLKVSRLAAVATTVFSSLRGARRGQNAQVSAPGHGWSGGLLLAGLALPLALLVGWRTWRTPSSTPPPVSTPVATPAEAPAVRLAATSPTSPKPPEVSQESEHRALVPPSLTTWTKIPLSPPDPKLTLREQWQADRERARMLEAERLRYPPPLPTESEAYRTMMIARNRRLSEEREQLLERVELLACEVFRQDPSNVDAAEMSFRKFEAEGDYVQAIRACDLLRNVLTPPAPDRGDLLREVLASYRNCEPNIPYGQNPIWRDEVETRARDAALPSERALPQVKVALESGSFVIELFEEDVPNAVANFVSLTEKGFYNGKWLGKHPTRRLFHGGETDPTRDTENNAGHRIPWEQSRRNSHDNFDGQVAMVTTVDHNGASSLFQIVDGDQQFEDQGALLIGRVVEGMEVVRAIVKNEKMTASVIRKRTHPYAPRVLPLERGTAESEAPIRMRSPARPPESERWLSDWNRLLTLEAERTNVELNVRAAKREVRDRWIAKLNSVSEQRDQLAEQVHSEAPSVFRLDRNNAQAARLSYRRLFDNGDFVEAIRACDAVRDTYLLWSQLALKIDAVNVMIACRRKIAWEQDPVWQEELAARAREDALPPDQALPRVKISLERGAFVVELFEDETPNTVANFINLVEKGFYDGKQFWRTARLPALIGGDNAEGFKSLGNAGYRIPFEHAGRRTRHNYEGTIGMHVGGEDFTGSSVFYVSDVNPSVDTRGQLPFGRVVEGMEVVRAIQKDDKMTATVVRKRNHPYFPRTLPLDSEKSAPPAGDTPKPGKPATELSTDAAPASKPLARERWMADWNRLNVLLQERAALQARLGMAAEADRPTLTEQLNRLIDDHGKLAKQVEREAPEIFRQDRDNVPAAQLSFARLFHEGDFIESIRACDTIRDAYPLLSQREQRANALNILKSCREKISWEQDPLWQEELAARTRSDALSPDQALPRVKISLERGSFIIELFEDEAPNTVANFIRLVEKGFYDGKRFWGGGQELRILGIEDAQGVIRVDNAGYRIPFEYAGRRARHNFEGTLAMRLRDGQDSCSSVFHICLGAMSNLDHVSIPFGRVVEGLEVVRAIETNDTMTAAVIRKRNHPYVPRILLLEPDKAGMSGRNPPMNAAPAIETPINGGSSPSRLPGDSFEGRGEAAASSVRSGTPWPAGAPRPAIAPFDAAQARKHQDEWAAYLKIPVEYTNSLGMKFRLIPPGESLMGTSPVEMEAILQEIPAEDPYWKACAESEVPQHRVRLTQPIYLGVHEVTQAQYNAVMHRDSVAGVPADGPRNETATTVPANGLGWNDTASFCLQLSLQARLKPCYSRSSGTFLPQEGTGYRLPTEAEWEMAARAGTITRFWMGNETDELSAVGWFGGNSQSRTHVVGELKANPFGLHDVYGNVWEWVQDGWQPTYQVGHDGGPAVNPIGAFRNDARRVIRGGSWTDTASRCRSAYRHFSFPPYGGQNNVGFRVALMIDAVKPDQ